MASHRDIAARFAQEAGKPNAQLLRAQSGNVLVSPFNDRDLCSYGTHFVLARIMLDEHGDRSWWLLNGDTYSVSTSGHQRLVREECGKTVLPVLIVPFSCLREARIDRDTITPIDIQDESFETVTHYAHEWDSVPDHAQYSARLLPDGRYAWHTHRHWLGASLFRAAYTVRESGEYRTRTAYFLSAFDEQETRPHYFLCELPHGAAPTSVSEAFEALKPPEVIQAETDGLTCTRQGDVFAVPTTLTTRQVSRLAHKRQRGVHVLHLSHTATEVAVTDDGTTYARGILRHAPPGHGRQPEHKRQPMGDRKTWHQLVKNTVPLDARGDSRAWSRGGNVD
ncbi:hypothetical protein [Prauserella flavalba]|uniref:hypothetical protein n=1 Tax=Prauserella flavalba TaxID=1477506 RepID=UPI0036E9243F